MNNCTLALKIDENSSKALYRRAYARFAQKKDFETVKADLDKAQKSSPGDKAVATLLKKVRQDPSPGCARHIATYDFVPGIVSSDYILLPHI